MPVFSSMSLNKIDDKAVLGLSGVNNSLAYKVHEIERHLHGHEKWMGLAAAPNGELHRADRVVGTTASFQLIAGNNTFGSWVQILGSSDTPIEADQVKFDAHRFMVTATNSTNPYILQFVEGESAGIADKLAANDFTGVMYIAASNNNDSGISEMMMRRFVITTKLWSRCACIGGNGTTINFYYGIHEYEG